MSECYARTCIIMRMAWWNPRSRREAEARSISIGDPTLALMLGYSSPDGLTVSEGTAMTLSAVYRAVNLVAGSVATLPLASLQIQDDGRSLVVPSFLDTPGGG